MSLRSSTLVLIAASLFFAACGDESATPRERTRATVDTAVETTGDRYAIHTSDGAVELGLTDSTVYFWLSDSLMQEIDREVVESTE